MKKTRPNPLRKACLFLSLSLALLAACGNKESAPASAPGSGNNAGAAAGSAGATAAAAPASGASGAAAPMPPVTVSTVPVEQKDLAVRLRATGVVSPINSVDVKAQTNSIIGKVYVRDGQFVKAGDILFTLDARTEEANIVKAQAQLAKDTASLGDAQRQLKRTQELAAQSFIAQGQVDTASANVDVWTATVNSDKAAIDAARVALSYARILAPQSGRIGTVNVSNGATVQANITNLLTITQVNPIAVTFTLPQRNISDALEALKAGGAPVTATLADNGGTFKGKLQFVDSQIDAASGSVKAKAYFKNDEEKLWPGAYVEVQQTLREIKEALVIPQGAVIYSARGPFAYAVENGKAVARPLKIVQAQGTEIAVTGVTLGESIILEGKQNVRPGAPVIERSKDAAKDPKAAASSAETPASKASAP
jgi:RND family efflux transporter MFP subunit